MINRVVLIVMDSVGAGELPDASIYHDEGSNTIGNISKSIGGLKLENLSKLGLGNISDDLHIEKAANPIGCYGKATESSPGKDTTTGHWELSGIYSRSTIPNLSIRFSTKLFRKLRKKDRHKNNGK